MVKFYTAVLRLRGQDPTRQGKNKDIDFTRLGIPPNKLNARIDWGDYWDVKLAASAQHASQGGGTSQGRNIPVWLQKRFLAKDAFIRAYPRWRKGSKRRIYFQRNWGAQWQEAALRFMSQEERPAQQVN
ncbi:MAG: hypothetical protein M5U34_23615 [Chloroflexi bacterium]|nr:hypothetical protein [Chloroflexota bacterium]